MNQHQLMSLEYFMMKIQFENYKTGRLILYSKVANLPGSYPKICFDKFDGSVTIGFMVTNPKQVYDYVPYLVERWPALEKSLKMFRAGAIDEIKENMKEPKKIQESKKQKVKLQSITIKPEPIRELDAILPKEIKSEVPEKRAKKLFNKILKAIRKVLFPDIS